MGGVYEKRYISAHYDQRTLPQIIQGLGKRSPFYGHSDRLHCRRCRCRFCGSSSRLSARPCDGRVPPAHILTKSRKIFCAASAPTRKAKNTRPGQLPSESCFGRDLFVFYRCFHRCGQTPPMLPFTAYAAFYRPSGARKSGRRAPRPLFQSIIYAAALFCKAGFPLLHALLLLFLSSRILSAIIAMNSLLVGLPRRLWMVYPK